MIPQRVQRTRRKGQPGIPAGAIYVGRGSRRGNPYKIVVEQGQITVVSVDKWGTETGDRWGGFTDQREAAVFVVELYARMLLAAIDRNPLTTRRNYLGPLAGRDLCCWCTADAPCHADIPLILANGGGTEHVRRYLAHVRSNLNANDAVSALLAEIQKYE